MITNVIIVNTSQTKYRRVANTLDDMIIVGHIGYFDSIRNRCAMLVLVDEIQQNDGMTVSFHAHTNRLILFTIDWNFDFYTILKNIKRKFEGRHGHEDYTHYTYQYVFCLRLFCKGTNLREPTVPLIPLPLRGIQPLS